MTVGVDSQDGRCYVGPEYLNDMLQTLWPDGTWTSSKDRRDTFDAEWVVVPHLRQPKLLLPRSPRSGTASALRNYKLSATSWERVKLDLLGLAARAGLAEVLPHRVGVRESSLPSDSISSYLSEALGRSLLVSLYLGPPRAVQKPILQLLDRDGSTFGFAKIGTNPLTTSLVKCEVSALMLLGARDWTRLSVPAVLFTGSWKGNAVLVQEVAARRGSARVPERHRVEAMVELASVHGLPVILLKESPYLRRLEDRVGRLPPTWGGLLTAAVLAVAERWGDTPVPFGAWHGDWTPWNMLGSRGRVWVWDWEQYEEGVPAGFDAIHHEVNRAVVHGRQPALAALAVTRARATQLLAPFGVAADVALLVFLLYMLDVATKYAETGEAEVGGTVMGRLDQWLEEALGPLLKPRAPGS